MIFLPGLSFAGQTPWFDVAPDARLRLIFSDVLTTENTTMIAMELDMPTGTKTYWRVPGETGIPLRIDSSASSDVGYLDIIWPFPEREVSYGFVDHVFHGNFVLPIKVQVTGSTPRLDMRLVLGICSDICVPVSVELSHNLSFGSRDAGAALRIAQSMVNTPIPWSQTKAPVDNMVFDIARQELHVQIDETIIDSTTMIATINDTYIMFGAPQKSQIEDIFVFSVLGEVGRQELIGQDVTLVFMSSDGPYEITRPLELRE
jgi:DsbC/DsbD-like thiol-disulfide interchange protein